MKFNATIDRGEGGVRIVKCPGMPGYATQGTTNDERFEAIPDAICLGPEMRAQRVPRPTAETRQVPFGTEAERP